MTFSWFYDDKYKKCKYYLVAACFVIDLVKKYVIAKVRHEPEAISSKRSEYRYKVLRISVERDYFVILPCNDDKTHVIAACYVIG